MSKRVLLVAGMLVALSAASVSAQQQPPGEGPPPPQQGDRQKPPPPPDPLGDSIFPPEMIMQHQRELALTDAQKQFMRAEIQRTTNRFNELQWQLQDAMEALHEIMKGTQVSEQQAMAQLDKVLDAEREIKSIHMAMNIRIKNQLTAEQQMKLQTMRNTFVPRDGQPRRPGGPDGPPRPRPGGPDGMRGPGPGGPGIPRGGPGGGGPGPGGGRPGGPR